jgi:hypothetical protein
MIRVLHPAGDGRELSISDPHTLSLADAAHKVDTPRYANKSKDWALPGLAYLNPWIQTPGQLRRVQVDTYFEPPRAKDPLDLDVVEHGRQITALGARRREF